MTLQHDKSEVVWLAWIVAAIVCTPHTLGALDMPSDEPFTTGCTWLGDQSTESATRASATDSDGANAVNLSSHGEETDS